MYKCFRKTIKTVSLETLEEAVDDAYNFITAVKDAARGATTNIVNKIRSKINISNETVIMIKRKSKTFTTENNLITR